MISPAANRIQNIGVNIINPSIIKRFQEQVISYGDRLAIKSQDSTITYKELNGWANQIARTIVEKRGVGAEPIALLFETRPEAIAAMLGVLKAGKFYVPLDISWPGYRLNSILEDSQTELILSDSRQFQATGLDHPDWASVVSNRDVLWLDNLDGAISKENLEIQSHPDDLAYIIYTSGSSGQPKGVMQNHRYVLNLYRNYTNSGAMTEHDRFSLLYSAAFAGAVRDIYCALLNGAALLPLNVKQISLHHLGGWLQDNEITVMFAVATLFRHFAATLKGVGNFPKLRLIQIGSETVYRQDAELFQEHFSSGCTLMVNLGGTEISPVRQFPVAKSTVLTGSTVLAGYGVEGTEVWLWDESGQEVPPGEVGEIVVSSRQVALGYWHQPELTERVFVSDGDRHYFKTGDLGQLLPDGCLLHLGRKDFQVKIRGYRVETSEVEGVLLSLESVREAVVTAQVDVGGAVADRCLVAYLTAVNSENKPTAKELKEAMATRLPDYAIPAYFVWLESLPLTATGKIDRRSLPKPDTLLTSDLDIVPARNATEEILVQIWSEVLNRQALGVENNFFDLGGNSLHASRVLARISEKFKSELSLKTIFAAPTIAQLAKHLESGKTETSLPPLVPMPTLRETQIPLSLAQQRLWFLDRLETKKNIYNLFRGFRLTGKIDVGCLERAIEAIIERHEILRTSFDVVDGVPIQAIAPSLPFVLEISDLQDLPATERSAKVEEITREVQGWNFDLAKPPLLKIVLICLSDREYNLLITMHHIISDDWSIQVFLKELSVIYRVFCQPTPNPLPGGGEDNPILERGEGKSILEGGESNTLLPLSGGLKGNPLLGGGEGGGLPPLPIQYADYTHWQHEYLVGDVLEEQLDYWRTQLADVPPLLELPTDFPRINNADAGFQSGIVSLKIDSKTTEKLKNLSQRSQTTLFVTLLTAWAVLLSRYSNQEDIVVGTAIANRNPAITEQLIGFFVSTLALRIKLLDNPTFLNLLDRVQQTALDAHAHADVPFDRLVEALQIQRHSNYNPIFQVMFILQNVTQENLVFPSLETQQLDFLKPTAGATFDLTLSLTENSESLVGTLEYNTNLFLPATIEGMAGHFLRLVEAITDSPEMAITKYPLLSSQERQQLLIE
ncbi:MAG: AMP-binding protein, partial [Okeania sp. SIO3B5]|uniref:condensation domain-containing protein n=1 Tax=Okeania sp. SIO3B5 TaxID=2607811 RepID=UPI0013FEDFE3